MIAVIFEVLPNAEHKQEYLDIAAELRPVLEQIDGFISVERFQSLSDENKILSLSFFENEEAVQKWRTLEAHRNAQKVGRSRAFDGYRLRVAHVMRDYSMSEREQAPTDSQSIHQ
ncbi:putative enzyme involved in biosynthesis of extracellular polysaccharides [Candidatus Terasakiella magnetica]|uniref:Putative enzyme involved in biosynthesis of extracellular polysaccharides n=1 Tax=Candidatus Terasakiella magnetica TaxID=1867952 RepID=A0A1C3RG11_9PROT|nr:antibiotic biosynthesis monooxygenase [Candidatus Terasakiella magnetica]SCA56154.1 putative enzyme involved in biosynthesis of extracellular polysaccharides [Candidatus Terasakiella magnetica]